MKSNFAIELKDGDDADPAALVTKALDGFQAAFDERLKAIETKAASNDNAKLVDRLDKLEAKSSRPNLIAGNDNEPLEKKAFNAFLRGGVASLDDIEKKTLNAGTPASGGYVVAPEYSSQIIQKLQQFSPMRGLASSMTIGGSEVYIPTLQDNIAGGWVTETGARPSTEPTFGQMNFKVFEYAGYVPVSQQLLEDNHVDLQSFLLGHIAKQFGKAESTAFMLGDGNGKPTGLLATPTNYAFTSANSNGSDIIDAVIAAFYKLPGQYAASGSWIMRRETQGVIRAAADGVTKGAIWADSLANGTPATLLGRPVYESVDMSLLPTATGTTYPIAFADFSSAYQVVDRVGVGIQRDDFTGADNGIVKFRARRRVGGAPLLTEAAVLVRSVRA